MIKLTMGREITPYVWSIPTTMIGDDGAGAAPPMLRLSI
jgi:hypothetical protein